MTPDEIQDLREKHQLRIDPDFGDYCLPCSAGNEYPVSDYPCDVIKVLDYAKSLLEELKNISAHRNEGNR